MDTKKNVLSPQKDNIKPPKKPKLNSGEHSTYAHVVVGAGSMDTDTDSTLLPPQPVGSQAVAAPVWFTSYMTSFEARLENRIQSVITDHLADLSAKLDEHEEKLTSSSIQISDLEQEVKKLKVDREDLAQKLDDLENRARRNNLVFYGVPEKAATSTLSVMKEVLEDFVGLPSKDLCIERCHRTPTNTTASREELEAKPRMIHMCFSSFQAKEKVRQECVSKFKSSKFQEKKLFVSEDFSKRVMQRRKNKMEEFQKLKGQGKKPFFLFPDRLAYKDSTGKLHIVS